MPGYVIITAIFALSAALHASRWGYFSRKAAATADDPDEVSQARHRAAVAGRRWVVATATAFAVLFAVLGVIHAL